jgi:hypothetical protein
MPNFDGGHYFLTILIPIRTDVLTMDNGCTCSPVSMVHSALSTLPTALQSPVTQSIGINSPFARSPRTHFARFAVIDDVIYNGRNPVNALKTAANPSKNAFAAQPVDQLNCPYLMFVADFDAKSGDESEVRSYLDELWNTMQKEFQDISYACVGSHVVQDSKAFQDYMLKCQVQTTMPFNDYWVGAPPLKTLSILAIAAPAAIAAVVTVGAFIMWLMGSGSPWGMVTLLGLAGIVLGIFYAYARVMGRGAKPFPTAPHTTLPCVLKSLYLQQKFTQFALETQGLEPAQLHNRFGQFLSTHRPADMQGPTQSPGVIHS